MHQISIDFGFKQMIHAPIRGDYLIDVCLSDIHDSKA